MRSVLVLVCCVSCATSALPPAPIAAVPVAGPAAPTCAIAAAQVRDVYEPEDKAEAAHDVVLARCAADHWGDNARWCIARADTAGDVRACFDQLTAAQRTSTEDELARAVAVRAVRDLPEGCHRYAAAVDRLASCDKLPDATKQAVRDSFDQVRQAWSNLPPDALEALDTACTAATDAIEQAAAGC